MQPSIIVYDSEMKKRAILENAFSIGYEKKLNEIWTAYFTLPADDPKNEECKLYNFVEIYDNGQRVELFRIVPTELQKSEISTITYQLEHVLATLIDDIMFQYHEIGGLGIFTTEIIEYVLGFQSTEKWVLGTNDFARQFAYKWENENLLGSLFSIPNRFVETYQFTFDTTVFPWVLNLTEIIESSPPESYVRYKKNMVGMSKEEDPTELCTRLYCLGYGEGINQLTIAEVNGGIDYLDAPTQSVYGIVSRIFVDRRFEDAESLKARALTLLNELQIPRLTYEVQGADLSSITGDPVDVFNIGTYTRVIDTELGEDVKALIVNISKSDITANPGDVKITIANKPQDIATSISDLADRQRINEVYAQGATNLDSYNFVDNCDPTNPAILKFYIPEETVRINKMIMSFETASFRAYSKAIEGGGAFASTTEAGGSVATSSGSGGGTSTSTASGGGVATSSGSGGGTTRSSDTSDNWDQFAIYIPDAVSDISNHNHGISAGTPLSIEGGGSVNWVPSGEHGHALTSDHRHDVTIPNHQHTIDIPNHTHSISIPNHQHTIDIPNHSHDINIPNHVHQIEYGIFSGPTPTTLEIRVDNNLIPGSAISGNDVNIIPYLSKDSGGKIIRGWHEIKLTPNNLGRVIANVASQIFVQSRGGGNY